MPILYEKIGGEAAINATVEEFYKRILADDFLSPFFKNLNMARQINMQKKFLNHVFGQKEYEGKNMRKAHAHLHLTDKHFDRVAKHLSDAMLHLGVGQDLVDQVLAVAETTRADVLGRPVPTPWYIENSRLILGSIAVLALGGILYYRIQQ
jgi:hemoglobin